MRQFRSSIRGRSTRVCVTLFWSKVPRGTHQLCVLPPVGSSVAIVLLPSLPPVLLKWLSRKMMMMMENPPFANCKFRLCSLLWTKFGGMTTSIECSQFGS